MYVVALIVNIMCLKMVMDIPVGNDIQFEKKIKVFLIDRKQK